MMYQILLKMVNPYVENIVKSYFATYTDEEYDLLNNRTFYLSDVLDFAYCLAREAEEDNPKIIKEFKVSTNL